MDPYDIILHPYVTEKTMRMIEENNALQFVVRMDANKKMIKEAVEKIFNVKVEKVNTRITKKGKIAVVKLTPEYKAEDIGMRIGIF
ncbi:MAG: 50S ribosomal protein L23 [Thermoplasmata archaeon]|nr:MAG: 50S ribosomal protein L23 [Thermoplasmata archaeon]HDN96224.1 50S ribosomal protein L23 [Thermoplasmatales archaeon]